MSAAAQLRSFVSAWLAQVARMSYRDLTTRQDPPFPTLPFGAAGVAYALLRAGRARGEPALLAHAERWAAAAARHVGAAGELQLPAGVPPSASLIYGPTGIHLVRVLVASARGDQAATRRRIGVFLDASRPRSGRPAELLFGTAGQLAGTLTLLEATGDPRLRALAAGHARLLAPPRPPPWTAAPDLAFAHGRAGILHALLRWRRLTGGTLPGWFPAALEDLARAHPAWAGARRGTPAAVVLGRTWCNGSAGLALLWSEVHTQTGARRDLARARAALRTSLAVTAPAGGDLCCGLAGRAYAALALARALPRAGLRARALELAVGALGQMRGPWPNGLLKGYPGLVCLAVDLLDEARPRGFPLVES